MYKRFIKRLMDILLSLLAMIALSPVYLLVAIFARIFIGPKIIFKQLRIGKNDKRFYIYKFRTMNNARHGLGSCSEAPVLMNYRNFGISLLAICQ